MLRGTGGNPGVFGICGLLAVFRGPNDGVFDAEFPEPVQLLSGSTVKLPGNSGDDMTPPPSRGLLRLEFPYGGGAFTACCGDAGAAVTRALLRSEFPYDGGGFSGRFSEGGAPRGVYTGEGGALPPLLRGRWSDGGTPTGVCTRGCDLFDAKSLRGIVVRETEYSEAMESRDGISTEREWLLDAPEPRCVWCGAFGVSLGPEMTTAGLDFAFVAFAPPWRLRQRKTAVHPMAATPITMPTAIPALAPIDKPTMGTTRGHQSSQFNSKSTRGIKNKVLYIPSFPIAMQLDRNSGKLKGRFSSKGVCQWLWAMFWVFLFHWLTHETHCARVLSSRVYTILPDR